MESSGREGLLLGASIDDSQAWAAYWTADRGEGVADEAVVGWVRPRPAGTSSRTVEGRLLGLGGPPAS